jgi:hypothetical protein
MPIRIRPKNPFKVKASGTDLVPGTLEDKISVGAGGTITILNPGADEQIEFTFADPQSTKVKVTSSDTTPAFLNSKLAAGSGVTLTTLNPGANEQISISVPASGIVKVTSSDTTPAVLDSKVTVGTGLVKTIVNPGGNESISLTNPNSTKVAATSADTTPDSLNNKITAGNWTSKTTLNPGANETIRFSYVPTSAVAIGGSTIDWADPNFTYFKTLGANTTFAFSNTVEGKTIIVAITNTVSNFTVTWPAGIKWQFGIAPTMSLGAVTDIYTFVMINSIIYGAVTSKLS